MPRFIVTCPRPSAHVRFYPDLLFQSPPPRRCLSTSHTKPVTMEAGLSKIRKSLDDQIDTLDGNATEITPASRVFRTAISVLTFIRVRSVLLFSSEVLSFIDINYTTRMRKLTTMLSYNWPDS